MKHTDREYEAELDTISHQVGHMGDQLEDILEGAARALRQRNAILARNMIEADRAINRTELVVDGLCMQVLARRQPVASDLRLVMTVLKLVTDLERVGDLAKNICERVLELGDVPPRITDPTLMDRLMEMMSAAQDMVRSVIKAFEDRDVETALRVRAQDDRVDHLYHAVLAELLAQMTTDPAAIFEATRLQSIAKYIEHIGDHATNVAEMIVFLVDGVDVRHRGSQGHDERAT
jgi:phosphate transport system protein